jgi:hypothetical protein
MGTTKFHAGASISYKFVRLQKDGTPVWEADPNRNIVTPKCKQPGLVTGGPWQGRPTQCTARNVTFEVNVPTQNGETIYVVGSSSELGQWNANRAVALSANSYTVQDPIWRGNVSFVTGQDVLYKYIKGGIDGKVVWEAGSNRNFSVSAICDTTGVQRDRWQTS